MAARQPRRGGTTAATPAASAPAGQAATATAAAGKGMWFAVAEGRGTSLFGKAVGPFSSVADFQNNFVNQPQFGGTIAVIGNQNGYPTQAAAQAEADKYNKENVTQRVTQAGGNVAPDIPNPLHGIEALAAAVTGFFDVLTDVHMWISVGWLLLGIILMVLGVMLWMRQAGLLPNVAPVPVPV